jgi:hypothetical protein
MPPRHRSGKNIGICIHTIDENQERVTTALTLLQTTDALL